MATQAPAVWASPSQYLPHHEEPLVQGDGGEVADGGEHSLGERTGQ